MTECTICGQPATRPETHHTDHQRGNNNPDNLRTVCRRCHMHHHENDRAVDADATRTYGPRTPRPSPATPTTGPPTP